MKNKQKVLANIKKRKTINAKKPSDDVTVACVFSCPGRKEEKNNEFLSGNTGNNFIKLINILNQKKPDIFASTKKEGYHIENASNHIYYKFYLSKKDKRTTPYISDIKSKTNIERIKDSLSKMNIVISFGKDAEKALIAADIPFIKGMCHLGTKGLSSIDGESSEDKISNIAENILEQLSKQGK